MTEKKRSFWRAWWQGTFFPSFYFPRKKKPRRAPRIIYDPWINKQKLLVGTTCVRVWSYKRLFLKIPEWSSIFKVPEVYLVSTCPLSHARAIFNEFFGINMPYTFNAYAVGIFFRFSVLFRGSLRHEECVFALPHVYFRKFYPT